MRGTILLTTVLVLATIAPTAASAAPPPTDTVPSAVVGPWPGDETQASGSCGGLTFCTTGVHQVSSFISLGISGTQFVGIIENRLDWPGGSYVFRCDYNIGATSCQTLGEQPREGTSVLHTCRSQGRSTGLPGGTGSWFCDVAT